jgi:hypothetical protein
MSTAATANHPILPARHAQVAVFFLLIVFTCVYAALCGNALSYDGSWYFYHLLDTQDAFVPHGRYTTKFLLWPVLQLSHFTDNTRLLLLLYGLIYMAIPVAALMASWWVVRDKEPELFVWAALSSGVAMLPVHIVPTAEAVISIQLFWPILLGVLTGARRTLILALFSVALFFAHPMAFGYFALAAGVAFLVGRTVRSARMKACTLIFAALSIVKLVLFGLTHTRYEGSEMSVAVQLAHFKASLLGLPILSLIFVWFAAVLLFLQPIVPAMRRKEHPIQILQVIGVIVAGVLMAAWARDGERWAAALDARDLVAISAFPFMAFAILDYFRWFPRWAVSPPDDRVHRLRLTQLAGIVFALVLSIQSTVWFNLEVRLHDSLSETSPGCTPTESMKWLERTPLSNWAIPTLAIVIQGRKPEKLLLYDNMCSAIGPSNVRLRRRTTFPGPEFTLDKNEGWFDFSRVRFDH